MTYLIFHDDSYAQSFPASIIGVDEQHHGLILDQTAFFPGGGGQPPDQGWIIIDDKEIQLTSIKKVSGEIIHILPEDIPLPQVGTILEGKLDWTRRYQLMRTHTAMHILCGTIFRYYGASVTGGNMEPLKGRMDFEFASLQKEFVKVIEKSVNLEIEKGLPVSWRTIPREEAFQIPDLIRT